MSGYDFLADVTVLEVAQLGPSSLGGLLADMGARVIKIESPGAGDAVRFAGPYSVGEPEGFGYLHLRWNRGKESVAVDLKSPAGADIFRRLAAQAQVVIEGMRAGTLDKLGLGFEDLCGVNPAVVFCTLSGLGASGPYARLASHGPAYDAFGAIGKSAESASISSWDGPQPPAISMYGMGYPAALGVLAALHRALRTGRGALIEIAATDVAAHWSPETIDGALNRERHFVRPGFADHSGRMKKWSRLDNYRTKDGKLLLLELYYDRYWNAFLKLIGRDDLKDLWTTSDRPDETATAALAEIILTKDRDRWMELLVENDIPAMPVNSGAELVENRHFASRDNVYAIDDPSIGPLKLSSSPVKTPGQTFQPSLAPALGQHTRSVISELLGMESEVIDELSRKGILA